MEKFSAGCWLITVLLSWLGLGLLGVWGCSPEGQRDLTLAEKVHHARSVFLGRVVNIYQDPRFDYGAGSEVYLAEMSVSCVYKTPAGLSVPDRVNVTDVGSVPGHCHQSALRMHEKYIVLTINEHHKIMGEEIPGNEDNLDIVLKVCGLHLQNPAGSNAASDCRQPADEATCTRVVDYGHDHDHSHSEDHDHNHDGIPDHTAEEHHSHNHGDQHSSSEEDHNHDHDGDGQPDHTHAEHPHDHDHSDDHDHDHDGKPDHTDSEHNLDHDHSHLNDHDHDHDGKPDHAAEDHPWDHDHSHSSDHDHDHDGKPDHDASAHENAVTPDSAAMFGENTGCKTTGISLVLILFGFIFHTMF